MTRRIVKLIFLLGFATWLVFAMASTNLFEFLKSLYFSTMSLVALLLWSYLDDRDKKLKDKKKETPIQESKQVIRLNGKIYKAVPDEFEESTDDCEQCALASYCNQHLRESATNQPLCSGLPECSHYVEVGRAK